MSGSLLLWLLLALAIFWGVGVHNRLMRIRARGLDAFGSVEKHMRQYGELVRGHLAASEDSDPADGKSTADYLPEDWVHLLAALEALEQALKDARLTPLAVPALGQLARCVDGLQQAWEQLRSAPADLAGASVPEVLQGQWDAVSLRVQTARGGMNQILAKYNEAREQFPARLVVGVMGFQIAGIL
jgi:LemA protein